MPSTNSDDSLKLVILWNYECWSPADLHYDIIGLNQAQSQPTRNLSLPPEHWAGSKPIWSGKSSLKLIRERLITHSPGPAPAPPEALETDTNLQTNNKTVSDLIWWEVINVKDWQSLD